MTFMDVLRILLYVVAIIALGAAAWFMLMLRSKLGDSLENLRGTLTNLNALTEKVASSGILDQAKTTMTNVGGGLEKLEPVLVELHVTLTEARTLLGDAMHTSKSVRARVDDLAALQHELHDTSTALADMMTQLRDQDLGVKLGNVLADSSTLMADIGMLAESASSVLETGRPLLKNASEVLSSAKRGVRSIAGGAQAVKEGIKAGVDELTGHDEH